MTTLFVRRIGFLDYETPEALFRSIRLAKQMHCDRVMLFDSRGHIEPAHLDHDDALKRAEVMRTAAKAFRAAGIGVGINNLATVGMNFSPPRKHPLPFVNLVDFDGKVFTECFCPLDPGLQEHLRRQFAAWAAVGPDEVWVDDDFRYKTGASQCFCPLHLACFERITGRSWTRGTLISALTAEGLLPNELARRWARMQDDGLVELAQAIAHGVHEADPRVRVAFMGMTMKGPAYGTETLRRIGRTFCPEGPVLLRPEYGDYSDERRVGWNAYMTRWCTQRAFGEDFEAWPELETWPFTGFNHGARVTEMKLLWGAMHGFTNSTINVNNGSRMIAAVVRAKRQVAAIGEVLGQEQWQPRGVSIEMAENTVGLRPKPGLMVLEREPPAVLMRLGIPLWPDGGCGRILVGNSPLSREGELTQFATEGIILDRAAFEHVAALGRDDLLGGARSRPMMGIPVRERYRDDIRNGAAGSKVMSMELAIPVRATL